MLIHMPRTILGKLGFLACAVMIVASSILIIYPVQKTNVINNNVNFTSHDMQNSALVIDTSGHDDVIVLADGWMSGIKPVTVYSNISVQNYWFYRNGTQIRSTTNPVNYTKGTWNPSYVRTTQGSRVSGTLASLYSVDANQWVQNYGGGGTNRQADVIADFDQKVIGAVAYASLTDVWINATFSGTGSGTPTTFQLQRWNSPTSAWVSIASFTTWASHTARVHFTGANFTQFTNSLDSITLNNNFRVFAQDNANFQINVDQIAMNYKTTNIINTVDHYAAIDSFNIDSTLIPDGWYNLTARTRDVFGIYHKDTKWVRFDNTAPVFTTSGYVPSPPVYDNESISVLATITESNIDKVTGKYINQFGIEITHQETDLAFNHTDFFTNGSYSYVIRATDKAGNYDDTTVSFTVLHSVGFIYPTAFFLGNLVGNDYHVNLTTSNANHALIYIDGSLRDNVVGNTTFITTYFDLSEAPHVLKIEVYDALNRLTNTTDHAFRVYFEPYINIYSNLNNRDYLISVSTSHTKEVLIYIDLTLVDTVPGNSTFVKTYLNLAETTHTIKFETYDVLGILFKSTTMTFTVLPLNPIYVLFIDVIDDNTNLQIDYWASNTVETKIYIDGDLEYTVADETTFFEVVEGLSKGIHYIDVEIHDVDHDLFKSISTTIHIYAPASIGGGGGHDPPSGYPNAPNPPPTNEGSTIDYGPFASLTGQQSLWVVVIAGAGLTIAFIFFRRKKVVPKKNRSRKRR